MCYTEPCRPHCSLRASSRLLARLAPAVLSAVPAGSARRLAALRVRAPLAPSVRRAVLGSRSAPGGGGTPIKVTPLASAVPDAKPVLVRALGAPLSLAPLASAVGEAQPHLPEAHSGASFVLAPLAPAVVRAELGGVPRGF